MPTLLHYSDAAGRAAALLFFQQWLMWFETSPLIVSDLHSRAAAAVLLRQRYSLVETLDVITAK